ncbi:hypothetical protein COCNU_scaffold010097G000020 [Cocos nucifera]|nr:hypothetical protein [Cocos nucifera]
MQVEYLPIIAPLEKQQNAVHFAERTGYAMASTLNVVQTSHSYGDLMLMTRALELAKVEYLPIIAPLEKQQNAVHFAERTGYAMASTLNVVQTSHSYGDLMLMTRALELAKVTLIA